MGVLMHLKQIFVLLDPMRGIYRGGRTSLRPVGHRPTRPNQTLTKKQIRICV